MAAGADTTLQNSDEETAFDLANVAEVSVINLLEKFRVEVFRCHPLLLCGSIYEILKYNVLFYVLLLNPSKACNLSGYTFFDSCSVRKDKIVREGQVFFCQSVPEELA